MDVPFHFITVPLFLIFPKKFAIPLIMLSHIYIDRLKLWDGFPCNGCFPIMSPENWIKIGFSGVPTNFNSWLCIGLNVVLTLIVIVVFRKYFWWFFLPLWLDYFCLVSHFTTWAKLPFLDWYKVHQFVSELLPNIYWLSTGVDILALCLVMLGLYSLKRKHIIT